MSQNSSGDAWVGAVIGAVLMWLWLFLAASWVVSRWLTEQLFRHLLNPMLDYALDRNDGLVILLSAGMWGALFPSLFTPLLDTSSPKELGQAMLVLFGLGLAWGLSIGFWILLKWWSEVDRLEATYEPTLMLGEPVKLVSSPPSNGNQPLPTQDEMEAELDEIFGGVEEQESL